jgi:carboxyl-terminal processing protease
MKKVLRLVLFLVLLPGLPGSSVAAQEPKPAPSPELSDAQKRQAAFEIVWNTVNERFYDSTFGGVDWKKIRQTYSQLIATTRSDQEFHHLLQQMISELHQSHFLIIPKESIPKLIPKRKSEGVEAGSGGDEDEALAELEEDESITPLDRMGYKLSERLSTGIGIDLRVIKGMAVITQVERGSAAARAGLRPGFVIRSVEGKPLSEVIARFGENAAFQSVFRGELPLILLAGFINGERRSPVTLSYMDGRNRVRTTTIKRERLKGEMSPAIGNLPAMYTEFVSKTLPGGYGYIRFNAFMPAMMKKVCAALRAHHDVPGLILDLRGNQGGLLGMIGGLSGLLQEHQSVLGIMQSRTGSGAVMAYPQRQPYTGPLVIMIDSSTQSAAEMFASGLQQTGRAVVVGEKSAGNTLPSAIMKLPTGALFQYAFANYVNVSGQSLEGRGVIPNINVELNRRNLLTGADPQMAAALNSLRALANPLKELIADVTVTAPKVVRDPKSEVTEDDSVPPPPDAQPSRTKVIISGTGSKAPGTNFPPVDQIIDRYVAAIGGRAALEKLNSRVSLGTVELQTMGLTGTAEMYEQAPNKSTLIINVDGMGTIQQTFDGSTAWLQDPLDGYIKFPPAVAARLGSEATFRRDGRLREVSADLAVTAREKIDGREVFVVRSQSSRSAESWFFDVENGLLLRRGRTSYGDYREVDGVKLPFKVTDETSYGFGLVVRLNEIKHNVPIDQSKFMENPDCFTRPEQSWIKQ